MKWKTIHKCISNTITTLLFLVLLTTLFIVLSTKASGGEPTLFGYQLKTVLSGSMEPSMKTGSVIAIKPGGDMTRFKQDDIITFAASEDMLVTHRIVQVTGTGQQYITKGDSNDAADLEPVLSENIVGEYVGFTIPYVGYLMNFSNTKEGAALLLIIPGIFLIIYAFGIIWRLGRQIERSNINESID